MNWLDEAAEEAAAQTAAAESPRWNTKPLPADGWDDPEDDEEDDEDDEEADA